MFKQSGCASTLYAFHVICILQQTLQLLCLTIDNRLTHAVNDCYLRVSIGAKLPDADIALQVDVMTLMECKNNCSKYKDGCAAFSFGVGIKGNSTCLISVRIPALEYFEVHPEYDVYAKNPQDSLWCEFDRTYGSLTRKNANAPPGTKKISEKGPTRSTVTTELIPMSLSISLPYYKLSSLSHEKRIASGDYSHKPPGIISLKTDRIISTKSFVDQCKAMCRIMESIIHRWKDIEKNSSRAASMRIELAEIIAPTILDESRRTRTMVPIRSLI